MSKLDNTAEVTDYVKVHGLSGLSNVLQRQRDAWKKVPLNVAISGSSGTGKSSFVNAIRGLTSLDDGAAKSGVVEKTSEPTPYPHPNNPQLIFWDLPGVGTPKFPKEEYLDKVDYNRYDFFLIFSSVRFYENDVWLMKAAMLQKKQCYLIRSKIDVALEDEKFDHPELNSEESVLQLIREKCQEELENQNLSDVPLFLISNKHVKKWDFPKLQDRLIEDLPNIKRDAMVLSLSNLTTGLLKRKGEVLRKRIWVASALSATVGAVPVPGLSMAVDATLLVEEAVFYRTQLGLDDASLQVFANTANITVDRLKEAAQITNMVAFHVGSVLALMAEYASAETTEEVMRFVPVIGSAIAGSISFATTYKMLSDILDKTVEMAIKLMEFKVESAV